MPRVSVVTELVGHSTVIAGLQGIGGAMHGLERSTASLTSGLKLLTIGLATLGLGYGLKSIITGFVRAGMEAETMRIRFKALVGGTQQANELFRRLTDWAERVPFSFQAIERAAATLLIVEKDFGRLMNIMQLTGEVAARTNLPFELAALQIQRAFSAGIGAADLFRQRGIKAMVGFREGVKYNADETRKLFLQWFENVKASGAGSLEELSRTLGALIEGLQDKVKRFQRVFVEESGIYDRIKVALDVFYEYVNRNFGSIEQAAIRAGRTFVQWFERTAVSVAKVYDAFKPFAQILWDTVNGLIKGYNAFPAWARETGLIAAILLGPRMGAGLLIALGAVGKGIEDLGQGPVGQMMFEAQKMLGLIDKNMKWERMQELLAKSAKSGQAGGGPGLIDALPGLDQYGYGTAEQATRQFFTNLNQIADARRRTINAIHAQISAEREAERQTTQGTGPSIDELKAAQERAKIAARLFEMQMDRVTEAAHKYELGMQGARDRTDELFKASTELANQMSRQALGPIFAMGERLTEMQAAMRVSGLPQEMFDAAALKLWQESAQAIADEANTTVDPALRSMAQQVVALHEQAVAGAIGWDQYTAAVKRLAVATHQASAKEQELTAVTFQAITTIQGFMQGFASSIVQGFQTAGNAMEAFKSLALNVVNKIAEMFMQLAVINPIMNSVFGGVSGFTPALTLGGLLGSFGGGGQVLTGASGFLTGGGAASSGAVASGGFFDMFSGLFSFLGFQTGGSRVFTRPSLVRVAETGPEAMSVRPLTHVGQGHSGGGNTYYIDARGSNGEMAIHEAIRSALRKAVPGIVETSVTMVRARHWRDPNFLSLPAG